MATSFRGQMRQIFGLRVAARSVAGRRASGLLAIAILGASIAWPSTGGGTTRHGLRWLSSAAAQAPAEDAPLDDPPDPQPLRPGDTDPPGDDPVANDEERDQDDDAGGGVALPTDRIKERQLDRVRRLIADGRWSDSATLVDEILGSDRDFFFRPGHGESTWRSIKTETARILGELPAVGREAYELQFRARADRLLEAAIASADTAGVVSVARRWFHTPAGRRATMLAAIESLERGQPLEAAAWLDRIAAAPGHEEFEPTLSVMRAVAWWRAGERVTAIDILEKSRAPQAAPGRGGGGRGVSIRVGGRDIPLAYPHGGAVAWLESVAGTPARALGRRANQWWLHRGDAARNALVASSRPLLVPRYRVPLTRHPEEARLLERRRKMFADRDMPLLPAGTPLAVDGLLLAHTPMGLLAIDFESGKRVWLQTGGASGSFFDPSPPGSEGAEGADADARAAIRGVFDDATSGTLSSNGELVFAVESDPASLAGPAGNAFNGGFRQGPTGPRGANVLSAYRIAGRGELAWRHPAAGKVGPPVEPQQFGVPPADSAWYLGAPLPIGDQLFVLVEERGEIRLDVLAAADGSVHWSQPLAELEDDQSIGNRESHLRRVGGLSPSFGDGVLVCPTGAGTAVAVDLATRTLLWAYNYRQPAAGESQVLPNGVRIRRANPLAVPMLINGQIQGAGAGGSATTGWRDGIGIVSGGRIILTPRESDEVHCLDLRSGSVAWKQPRKEGLYVAGVVDGRVIVVGRRGVEGLLLTDGTNAWPDQLSLAGACPSGRGIVTDGKLFLPLDTPEVVEIELATGTIAGRSEARGGAVAGNLVAYRGEVVSQGVGTLDVFHQSAALGERVDTALKAGPGDTWALLWKGQLAIDRGDAAAGLAAVVAAHEADPGTVPDSVVAEAMQSALERDFAAASPVWAARAAVPQGRPTLRVVVDGLIRAGDLPAAWETFRRTLLPPTAPAGGATDLVTDPGDRNVSLQETRWMQGRFRRLLARADPPLRAQIDSFVAEELRAAEALMPAGERVDRLTAVAERFEGHPVATKARETLVAALADLITACGATTDAGRDLSLRRDFVLLDLARTSGGRLGSVAGPEEPVAVDESWPFGRVAERRGAAGRGGHDDGGRIMRVMPIPVDDDGVSSFPGLRLGYDMQQPGLVATDGCGRRIGDPFGFEAPGRFDALVTAFQPIGTEASSVGRVIVVRSGPFIAGFELSATPGRKHRRLWTLNEASGAGDDMPMPFLGRAGVVGGRFGRLGNVPLGLRILEPDDATQTQSVQGGRARLAGVPVLVNTSLELHDPVNGTLLWERHRLPAGGELIGDEEFVCVVPASGQQSAVVSMADGQLERVCDLPRRSQRLLTAGRRIVALAESEAPAGADAAAMRPVTLELIDPATATTVALGTFAPESRATLAGLDGLAVVEPSGTLVILDLVTGAVRFRTTLPDMPRGLEQLRVSVWEDRYIVFVGRQETPEERVLLEKVGMITNLPQQSSARDVSQPATGSVWAVDRDDGAMLWPVPATVLRHCLHPGQPEQLPVLLFARQIQPSRGGDRLRMSILCLDKRTGQALCVDDKIAGQPHMLFGCEMVGDPIGHTVTVGRGGGAESADVILEFTGQPMAPRPPFQAASRQPVSRDVLSELEYWFEKALLLPLPF